MRRCLRTTSPKRRARRQRRRDPPGPGDFSGGPLLHLPSDGARGTYPVQRRERQAERRRARRRVVVEGHVVGSIARRVERVDRSRLSEYVPERNARRASSQAGPVGRQSPGTFLSPATAASNADAASTPREIGERGGAWTEVLESPRAVREEHGGRERAQANDVDPVPTVDANQRVRAENSAAGV